LRACPDGAGGPHIFAGPFACIAGGICRQAIIGRSGDPRTVIQSGLPSGQVHLPAEVAVVCGG